jgi:hypothetical protein
MVIGCKGICNHVILVVNGFLCSQIPQMAVIGHSTRDYLALDIDLQLQVFIKQIFIVNIYRKRWYQVSDPNNLLVVFTSALSP